MAQNIFIELTILIATAVLILGVLRLLKQPLIIGYIITGILFSPSIFNVIKSTELIFTMSEIGVALLLFLVGLNLNPKVIKEIGLIALITGIGQVVFTSSIGFLIARGLGLDIIPSIYISVALTFSSTIIIMKLLSDRGDLDKLYGKISIGFLIVQDLIAVFALMMVSSLSDETISLAGFASKTFLLGGIAVATLFAVGFTIIPRITKYVASSQEYLLLFSLGWCFAIASLFNYLGFSIEIGALLAGITLSISPYRYEMSSKLRPIRDFFLFIFFIWLGSQMVFTDITSQWPGILIFSAFILIGNPLIVIILMGLMNYRKQTSFMAGLTVAQISEFSLILIALGVKVGHLTGETLSFVTLIGIITIAGSSYMITYSHKIYPYFSNILSIFERESFKENKEYNNKYKVILFGAHRTGTKILKAFEKDKKSLLIIDYDPSTIEKLSRKGYTCIYGDVSDQDLLNDINIHDTEMIISTIPDMESNILFIRKAKISEKSPIIITTAEHAKDALEMYNQGVDYVILPHHLGGEYASQIIRKNNLSPKNYKKLKQKELPEIKRLIREKD